MFDMKFKAYGGEGKTCGCGLLSLLVSVWLIVYNLYDYYKSQIFKLSTLIILSI